MRVTLVVNPEQLQAVLPVYTAQLDAFSFSSGETYAEFVQGDKIAKYGLTALVAGGAGAAAAKLGLRTYLLEKPERIRNIFDNGILRLDLKIN